YKADEDKAKVSPSVLKFTVTDTCQNVGKTSYVLEGEAFVQSALKYDYHQQLMLHDDACVEDASRCSPLFLTDLALHAKFDVRKRIKTRPNDSVSAEVLRPHALSSAAERPM